MIFKRLFNYWWGLNNENHGISAQQVWNLTTGENAVIVGIVDTGIDSNHSDLTVYFPKDIC